MRKTIRRNTYSDTISFVWGTVFAALLGYALSQKVDAASEKLLSASLLAFFMSFYLAWRWGRIMVFAWGFTSFSLLASIVYLAKEDMVQTQALILLFSLLPLAFAFIVDGISKKWWD